MPEHVHKWLGAYLDNELRGKRLQEVQTHLDECDVCFQEYHELRKLSQLLHESTEISFTPADRFAANLILRLPRKKNLRAPRVNWLSAWSFVPAALLMIWVFSQVWILFNTTITLLDVSGMMDSINNWLPAGFSHSILFNAVMRTLGEQIAENAQNLLAAVDQTYLIGRSFLIPLLWQMVIGSLYCSWLVIWLIYHPHTVKSPLKKAV